MDTLILNADGNPQSIIPLSTISWKDAIRMHYLDTVDVLEYYDDWVVRSPSVELFVPSIIMLREFAKTSTSTKLNKNNLFLRDNYSCQYCGQCFYHERANLTVDHVIPKFHGGRNIWTNVVAACHRCNVKKSHFLEMVPRKIPNRPSKFELIKNARQFPITVGHKSWIQYLGWDEKLINISKSGEHTNGRTADYNY
jgi:5-methylcytosine-specific restriction endonuclease McrA